ncbi:MAG TPA: HEAT repeat domain-containing protein [Steroidobacteraceae bacterium]|nr:HEAT repeat domain-containing protein [Steroidobacteraceae bacterium]
MTSLDTYLAEMADTSRPLKTAKLTNLSQLSDEEREGFRSVWAAIDPERRLQIIQRISDVAEDNPEYDFSAVLIECIPDPDPRVRAAAIGALWEYEERDLIPILIDRLHSDEDADVRAAAALALGRFVLLGEFDGLRPRDLRGIEDVLAETINDAAETEEVRARALEALGARSEPWVRDLIADAYTSGEHRMQVSAVHAMGRSCDAYWLPDVIQQLQSDDAELRFEAATAAGMIGDEAAAPHLASLINDEDAEVQAVAIEALAEIGGSDARSALTRQLNNPDQRIREAAREAIASMELAGALDDADDDDP